MTARHDRDALAHRLLAAANDAANDRKAALCAYVAVSTTSSVTAARKVLAEWDGPAPVRRAARGLIDSLTSDLPAAAGDRGSNTKGICE